jgi:hypothetical protein
MKGTLEMPEQDEYAEQIKQELRLEYQQAQQQTDWWSAFYKQNPDLRAHDMIVKGVMQAHWSDFADLPASKAIGEIAEMSHKFLRAHKRYEQEMGERSVMVGGPGDEEGTESVKPFDYDEYIARDEGSLGGVIKRRKEARREASSRNLERHARESRKEAGRR